MGWQVAVLTWHTACLPADGLTLTPTLRDRHEAPRFPQVSDCGECRQHPSNACRLSLAKAQARQETLLVVTVSSQAAKRRGLAGSRLVGGRTPGVAIGVDARDGA
jgi:hypothetical protein